MVVLCVSHMLLVLVVFGVIVHMRGNGVCVVDGVCCDCVVVVAGIGVVVVVLAVGVGVDITHDVDGIVDMNCVIVHMLCVVHSVGVVDDVVIVGVGDCVGIYAGVVRVVVVTDVDGGGVADIGDVVGCVSMCGVADVPVVGDVGAVGCSVRVGVGGAVVY